MVFAVALMIVVAAAVAAVLQLLVLVRLQRFLGEVNAVLAEHAPREPNEELDRAGDRLAA